MVTANHYWLDAVGGVLLVAVWYAHRVTTRLAFRRLFSPMAATGQARTLDRHDNRSAEDDECEKEVPHYKCVVEYVCQRCCCCDGRR